MSNNRNSKVSHAQRVLYTKKGLRRKIYKKISKTLIEYGIEKSRIDEAIEWLKLGKIKIVDAELMKDIRALSEFDEAIDRLTKEIEEASSASAKQLQG